MHDELDTRLTDYALGELDAAARKEMEAQLATDAAAQGDADAIARLGRQLRVATVVSHATVAERNALLQDIIAAHLEAKADRAAASTFQDANPPAGMAAASDASDSPADLVVAHMPLYRRAAVWGGLAVAASVLFVGVMTWSRQISEEQRLAMVPEGLSSHPADRLEADAVRIRARMDQPANSPVPHGVVGDAVVSRPAIDLPTPNPPTPDGKPASVKVDVGSANVFTQSGAAFQAALPSLPGTNTYTGAPVITQKPAAKKLPSLGHGPMVNNSVPQGPTATATAAAYGLQKELEQLRTQYGPQHRRVRELEQQAQRADALQPRTAGEAYNAIVENSFEKTLDAPLSTFSIDVDTASYSNVRRFLNEGQLPPADAVRLEEFLNYFTYAYPQPKGEDPFSIITEAARCPWNAEHVLVRIGLKGREVPKQERPATNLVFLVDVSGSMQSANKLPLVRESLKMLVRELGDKDRVAIVVYAGSSGLVLPSTGGDRKQTILEAIDRLEAGGSTNGAAGIQLAYQIAVEYFIKGGVNRVVLATDGDFNVGVTSQAELVKMIEEKAKSKVFFSGLAYGTGNLKDATLEQLADKGNGNYAYIDSLAEARKVLVEQMSGTLVTIAKDVKVQIEFNPMRVQAYRLIGYENRILAAEDFNNDKKDAGEIGAGHTVTALYEVVPVGVVLARENVNLPAIDPLKYQKLQPKPQPKPKAEPTEAAKASELLTLKLRYKQPEGDVSKLIERPLKNDVRDYGKASTDFKFAASVAAFGMLLRDSKYSGSATFDGVLELAQEGIGRDGGGYRREFLELVRQARLLKPAASPQQ